MRTKRGMSNGGGPVEGRNLGRTNITKVGGNKYMNQDADHTTARNPGADRKFRGSPIRKIGTPFKFHDVQMPPAGWDR